MSDSRMAAGGSGSPRPRQREIVGADARVTNIFDGGREMTEGVAAGHDGMIYFSDITPSRSDPDPQGIEAGHIWRLDPESGDAAIYRSPSGMANGIVFDRHGRMIVAEGADNGGRRVSRTDMRTARAFVVANAFDGLPLNSPNDVTVDAEDRIYFTDPRYFGREPTCQPVAGVYRIDADGVVHRIVTDMRKPNGLAISPDQTRLYVSESDNGSTFARALPPGSPLPESTFRIHAYALSAVGDAGPRHIFADLSDIGQPDGMRVDRAGNLYVALARPEPTVAVFAPDGEWLARIDMPAAATNVEFGRGSLGNTLFVTAGRGLYRVTLLTTGFHLPAHTNTAENR